MRDRVFLRPRQLGWCLFFGPVYALNLRMASFAVYAAMAIAIACVVFVLTEFLRQPDIPAAKHLCLPALITGLLWPVVLLGCAECGLIAALSAILIAARTRRTQRHFIVARRPEAR